MKKILLIFSIIVIVFIIYITTVDRKIYYVALGDNITTLELNNNKGFSNHINNYLNHYNKLESYINQFSKENYRITDIISDINNNKKIIVGNREKTIKNALIKADLLTLSIGLNDFTAKINNQNIDYINDYQTLYNYVDQICNDLEQLLVLIRQYCKEEIFLVGMYYPYSIQNIKLVNVFSYLNNRFKDISEFYDINYVDIYDLFMENPNYISSTMIYPSKEGLEVIASQIIVTINTTIIKNS